MEDTSPVIQDYLQTIHYMTRDGERVISARLAERLGVTPATVAATLQRMIRDDLIAMDRAKTISFTTKGSVEADRVVRRHALAEWLLTKLIGMPWHEANEYAHHLEHVITDKLEARLEEVLGHPTTCPHGNPMPGSPVNSNEVGLDSRHTGDGVLVQRITEEAEESPELMEYLQRFGVVPGARLSVEESAPYNGLITLRRDGETFSLGNAAASKVRVLVESSA
ncbi:MAG: metal-dependent transcriptional regulator [Chloroflexota bacterium]